MRTSSAWVVGLVGMLVGAAVAAPPGSADKPHPSAAGAGSLRAVVYAQAGSEARACALQAFRLAERLLDEALADPCRCADVEQAAAGGYACKPPAVVLDVDETVLDNAAYNARLLRDVLAGARETDAYDRAAWKAWVAERRATAVPGARTFLARAAARGVAVFYVTNRADDERQATYDNLVAAGLPASIERVLTLDPGSPRAWDKRGRRRAVAATHRIALLVGDDLNDFVGGTREVAPDERERVLLAHRDRVGTTWVVLPNAAYGGWWDAVRKDPAAALRADHRAPSREIGVR